VPLSLFSPLLRNRSTWLTVSAVAASLLVAGCGVSTGASAATATAGVSNSTVAQTGMGATGSDSASGSAAEDATTSGGKTTIGVQIGDLAPDFSLRKLGTHDKVTLASFLGKTPVVLNAWASWCPPCNHEAPMLVSLAKQLAGKVQFVGINMTSLNDSVAAAKAFVAKYHLSYPVLLDTNGLFDMDYRILGLPTTFVLNQRGIIVAKFTGELTSENLQEMIRKAESS
jgi:thiol-disulfide isomerase/thioredoxin